VLFIAEIGMNHNGNFGLAYELIKQAKYAGADIAKFQLGWRDKPDEINHITPEILRQLQRWCDHIGIEFMVSVISESAWEMAKNFGFKTYKIASRTVKEKPDMVREILAQGRPTIISLGMWEGADLPFPKTSNISYLWCRSKYPCEPWDLVGLPKDFSTGPYDGYSDHTIGIESALIAITRGARIVEKHFTLDKSDRTIRDHALSATPEEFRSMVNIGRDIHAKLRLGV
jgi:N,N'-diacetyllegionaminate synthase